MGQEFWRDRAENFHVFNRNIDELKGIKNHHGSIIE